MRQILIELHIPGKEVGDFFILEHPTYGDKGFYPQCISYSYFHDRELNRAFPNGPQNTNENGLNWMQYARTVKYCSEHNSYISSLKDYLAIRNININHVPVCKGVWDFYDKIGYDRKRKKYI
jgi:hypothetical protein